jgi:hypothetical protein
MLAAEPTLERSNKVSGKTDSGTVAEITHSGRGRSREYLKEIAKKAGRPKSSTRSVTTMEEGEAFESIKRKWTFISHKLADEAAKAARDHKKLDGKSLVALCTAAGIAYDKRWSKQVGDAQEVAIPPILAERMTSKALDLQALTQKVALLSEECDRYKMLIQAADEGMIGP